MMEKDYVLCRMGFTLVCDREIPEKNNPYYISPGGYELANGKRFDFISSCGSANPDSRAEVNFIVSDLDRAYTSECNASFSEPLITEGDLAQSFAEFFVNTGEANDPYIGVKKVKGLFFELRRESDGKIHTFPASYEQMQSINARIALSISNG